ncbi:non-heme iron oxygenase ferredoxin subunit [Alicyclobacillus sp. SO9]|uniref:Rieske (2Fe-2S) protein n=1 Tax=Alicyclobacillus sp. SO9 TaxID=2665646 RepID=UPI0018E6F3CC|nr:non-heme iron oxygenase ferredoxin subunit [Alicyclobacillus sp. SO9]QQE80289.1 non-heme iron oxygenase ferredoxin subunit [Alicyclobacillus sp. SO9]
MSWTKVASAAEVAKGSMRNVEIDDEYIGVYHTMEDEWYATSNICTHAGETLTDGTLEGCVVQCPKHGGQFDVSTGAAVKFPCVMPVETYQIEIRDGEVYIDFEE